MSQMAITYRRPDELRPSPNNARTHSRKQIRQIAKSIESFNFNHPILIDEHDRILCGHARSEAAKLLKIQTVPTVRLDHLSEEQKRAFVIASNRLAELAGWDEELLALELGELDAMELEFDLTSVGFETAELDQILAARPDGDQPDDADNVPHLEQGPPVSALGDLWRLGSHRLLCGDATQDKSYEQLLGSERAQLILTDIPYNLEIPGHVSGLGNVRHENFAMASGEMSEAEFTRFLSKIFRLMAGASASGSIHFIFIDWRHLLELLRAGRIAYTELKNLVVWVKSAGGMGSLYCSQHELIAVFKSGDAPHVNNVELGRFGRNRTNVWTYAGMNSFQSDREEMLAMHPNRQTSSIDG